MSDRYVIIGTSYKHAPSSFRDKLYLDEKARKDAYITLETMGYPHVMLLATCDRVEIHGIVSDLDQSFDQLENWLLGQAGLSKNQSSGHLFRHVGHDAIAHLYAIASALDSQMIGESQILGQLKQAWQDSIDHAQQRDEGLAEILESAFALAKRVRNETKIGEGAVSTAAAAVKLSSSILGDISKLRLLIIGLHETGQLLAEQFKQAGCSDVTMTGPARRTERYASQLGYHFTPYKLSTSLLSQFDIILTCLGNGRVVLTTDMIRDSLSKRRNYPQILLDCGVPRDTEKGVEKLSDAFTYSLDDLEKQAEKGQTGRHAAAIAAKALVDAALLDFRRLKAEKEAVPVLLALKDHFEATRQSILNRHPGISADEATRLLINRLLHNPARNLREIAGNGGAADLKDHITINRVLDQIFDLSSKDEEG